MIDILGYVMKKNKTVKSEIAFEWNEFNKMKIESKRKGNGKLSVMMGSFGD